MNVTGINVTFPPGNITSASPPPPASFLPWYTGAAVGYAAFTSSGFIVAVLIAWLLLAIFSTAGNRTSGSFGKFMMLMEAVDALPEAMVIAGAAQDGKITIQFATSIFLLNLVNTLATALDYLSTRPEKFFHRIMVVMIFFSVGSLFFSVSSTIFNGFLDTVRVHNADYLLLFPIFSGMICGMCLVGVMLLVEHKYTPGGRRRRQNRYRRGESSRRSSSTTSIGSNSSSNSRSRNSELEFSGSEDNMIEMDSSSLLFVEDTGPADDSLLINDSEIILRRRMAQEKEIIQQLQESGGGENDEHQKDRAREIAFYRERVRHMEELLNSSEYARRLSSTIALPITDDAQEVIQDALLDRVGTLHKEGLVDLPLAKESLTKRAMKLMVFMSCLWAWTVLLTFILSPIFDFLDSHFTSSYISAFADGLSGGAFLSLISSTMIPRIQQDAYRSHWSAVLFKSFGMIAFIFGITVSFCLGFIPAPGQPFVGGG